MARFATPGVYIKERNAFGVSGSAVPTAVPAFIGYTEKAVLGNASVLNQPVKIESMADFEKVFGGAPEAAFVVKEGKDTAFEVSQDEKSKFFLYYSMRLFYANGGGNCYVVSVGDYSGGVKADALLGEKTNGGLKALLLEQEPTMVVVPDAVLLPKDECYSLYRDVLKHCGRQTKSRVAIFDVFDGYKPRTGGNSDVINAFRDGVGDNWLGFGACYYPWLQTTIVTQDEVNYSNFKDPAALAKLLLTEAEERFLGAPSSSTAKSSSSGADKGSDKGADKGAKAATPATTDAPAASPKAQKKFNDAKAEIEKIKDSSAKVASVDQTLRAISPLYRSLLDAMREELNLLPTCGAMAGLYSLVDDQVGVHKAPANVKVNSVVAPSVNISSENQEDLNVPMNGKSVNAIRSFIGKGVLVWGARTLDGNSQDWRYVNVRRTMIMLQQSIKNMMERYVFEPNTSQTWIKIRASLVNFLTGMWRQGTLVGTSPTQAFEIQLGLGSTMSPQDVLDGIMRLSIKVAISRPAEFIEITFEQKMQEGVDAGGGDEGGGDEGGEE